MNFFTDVYASMNSTNTPIKHPEHREDGDRNDCEIIVLSKALTYVDIVMDYCNVTHSYTTCCV